MKRRKFITLLGGAAAAWPLAARSQQPAKLPTIGILGTTTASAQAPRITAFTRRLHQLGWIEGQTVVIEYRSGGRSIRALCRDRCRVHPAQSRHHCRLRQLRPSLRPSRPHRSFQLYLPLQEIPSVAGWSPVCRGQAATSRACRSSRRTLPVSASSSCVR